MVDFGLLPPEVNSALIYAGPGSGPMLAAAAAWDGLAADLHATAASYGSTISELTSGPWLGSASAHMAAAAAPHLAWLSGTAGQAEQAAGQAAAAAAAYEAAFAATVPPPVIAANRMLLMALLATNFLGQNTPAIAAAEAEYAAMWGQDAAAMYGYAGTSAVASTLTPFVEAAPMTALDGVATQGAAVAQAVGTSAASDVADLTALTTTVPDTLSGLSGLLSHPAVTAVTDALGGVSMHPSGSKLIVDGMLGDILGSLTGSSTLHLGTPLEAFKEMVGPTRLFATTFQTVQGIQHNFESAAKSAVEQAAKAASGAANEAAKALPAVLPGAAGLGGGVAGTMGKAASVGALTVPQSWAATTPAAASPATAIQVSSAGAAEPGSHTLGGMPMTGAGGRGPGGFAAPRYGFRPAVVPHPPAGG